MRLLYPPMSRALRELRKKISMRRLKFLRVLPTWIVLHNERMRMKDSPANQMTRKIAWITGIFSLIWILTGCKGIPTQGERTVRRDIQTVGASYRPSGQRPALPKLTPESGLSNYLQYAILNQPEIEAAYYDWAASAERITTARSFPDPQLTFQMDIQDVVTSVMPGLMVGLPGPGKRHALAEVASAESQARYFTFETRVLRTTFNLKQAYYRLHLLNAKIQVNRQTLTLLAQLEKLAASQNEVGKATLQDVLRAQIEQERLSNEITNLEDSRNFLTAQFKAALGLGADKPEPPFPTRFETTSLDQTSGDLFATALARNPRLKQMESEVRQAQASIAVAQKARIPDFAVGLEADAKTSPVLYRPQFAMTLPIWRDKLAAQLAEAQANKHSAQARLSTEQIGLAVDFAEKSFMVRENGRNIVLLQERLLPKARKALDVARTAYLSGQTDFLNVIDAQRMLLEFELMDVEARVDREIALAELSLVVVGQSPEGAPLLPVSSTPATTQTAH